jgi:hypothetical protein
MLAQSEEEIVDWIYGKEDLRVEDADSIKESCILTPLNDASLEINLKVCLLAYFPYMCIRVYYYLQIFLPFP